MNILFTVCGRAGSKGFKNKNLKKLNGIPLVYYTLAVIELYAEKHTEDNVSIALNTDSEELKMLVEQQKMIKDVFYIDRKAELAGDVVPKVEVIKDTYLQSAVQKDFDIVIDLDITSPMRRVCDVENAIDQLMKDKEYDLVFSVVPARRSPYFNMVEKKDKYYKKICNSDYTTRQQTPKSYEMNASIYAYNPRFLKGEIEKTILDYNCGIIVMEDYLVLDIDSEEDFELMGLIVKLWIEKDELLREVAEKAKDEVSYVVIT